MKFWNPFKVQKREAPMRVPEKVYIEREGSGLTYSFDELCMRSLLNGYYADSNFIQLFYCLPEVFSPINEIASRVADATWQLRKDWNDEVDYNNQQFNRLFSKPNALMSFKQMVYQSVCYELTTGKEFFFANIPDTLPFELGSVVSWWNLPAQNTCIEKKKGVDPYSATDLSDFILRYSIPQNGGKRIFTPEKVLPMCNLSLFQGNDITCTASPLLGAEKAIKNLIPVYEARGMIYIKRGIMGFIVSRKGDESGQIPLTKGEKEELQRDFYNTKGITGNRDPITITSQPVDFVKTSMSIAEMQPFEETLADAVTIYRTLRVPRHLVPSKDNSTFANASQDMKTFYSEVIIPWAQRYAEAWTSFFRLPEMRRYINADFSHVDVLQENRKEKAEVDAINGKTFLQAWQNGACTLNDWVVGRGDKKVANPLYDKRIFEMTPEEIDIVKNAINLKTNGTLTGENQGTQTPSSTDQQTGA